MKTLKNNAVLMMQKGTAVLAEVVNDCAAAARAGLTELEKSEKQATEEAEIEEAFEF